MAIYVNVRLYENKGTLVAGTDGSSDQNTSWMLRKLDVSALIYVDVRLYEMMIQPIFVNFGT